MNIRTRSRHWVLFLGFLATLVATAGYTVATVSTRVARVEHASKVMVDTRSILVDMIDAETGLRGFLVTNSREFLRPYHEGVGRLHLDLAKFKVKLPPSDQLKEIEGLTASILAEFVREIDLADRQGIEAARVRFVEHPTKPSMDSLRDVIATERAAEGRDLETAQDELRAGIETTANLLNCALISTVVISITLATSILAPPGTEEK